MKKGFFVGLILFISVFVAMLYLDIIRFNKEKTSPFDAIPNDAAVIISSDAIHIAREKIASTKFESVFTTLEPTRLLDNYLQLFDSLLFVNNKQEKLSTLFSLHVTGANSFDLLNITDFNNVGQLNINKLIKNISPNATVVKRLFENIELYEVHFNEYPSTFTFCYQKGLLIGSCTPFLVEYAIMQLSKNRSIVKDPFFAKIKNLAGKNYDLTIYLNYLNFSKYLALYTNESGKELLSLLSNFAEWSELDVIFKEESIYLNGYTLCNDSSGQYLNQLSSTPKKSTIGTIAPDNTALMVHYSVDDFTTYINTLENNHLPEKLFGGEWSYIITEPYDLEIKNTSFFCLKINDVKSFRKLIDDSLDNDLSGYTYKEFRMNEVKNMDVLDFIGSFNKQFHHGYYTVIQDYAVFAHSQNSLKSFIDKFIKQEVLDKNFNYVSFLENLISNSNINVYVNTQMIGNIIQSIISSEDSKTFQNNMKIYRKAGPMAFQFSFQRDIFFTNGYINYIEEEFAKNNLLWSTGLESHLSGKPTIVKNHYTEENEVILQDENNVLYLISKGGNILWKRQIDGPIISEIFQMDFYNNSKLQYFFNSRDKIYLIDRNAEDVEGYPLRLNDPASNGVFLIDYDGNKKYRYFIASENGNVYGYEETGKPLPGWNPKREIGEVTQAVKHYLVNGKDYLLINNTSGTLYLFDRKGNARIAPIKMNTYFKNEWYLDKINKEYRFVNIDTTNHLYQISLAGNVKAFQIKEAKNNSFFMVKDINQNETNEYILIAENQLAVYKNNLDSTNLSKSVIFNYELDGERFNMLSFENIKGFGVCEKNRGYAYYFLPDGTLHVNFPFKAVGLFTINDLYNDGNKILIIGDEDARIGAYRIE